VCSAEAYPLVKSFYEEFDNPGCYLPDCQPPIHVLVVSDGFAFRSEGQNGWQYDIKYTDDRRREAQRLHDKWARLKPELEKHWDAPFERTASTKYLGDRAHAFCTVYLARRRLPTVQPPPMVTSKDGKTVPPNPCSRERLGGGFLPSSHRLARPVPRSGRHSGTLLCRTGRGPNRNWDRGRDDRGPHRIHERTPFPLRGGGFLPSSRRPGAPCRNRMASNTGWWPTKLPCPLTGQLTGLWSCG
jgi:hypothetical protein